MSADEPESGDEEVAVVRDSTFARFTADRILISDLGRDLEVSFIQVGPLHVCMEPTEDGEKYTSRSVLTEVARLRTGFPAVLSALMEFVREGIEQDKIKGAALANQIMEWAKDYQSNEEE